MLSPTHCYAVLYILNIKTSKYQKDFLQKTYVLLMLLYYTFCNKVFV